MVILLFTSLAGTRSATPDHLTGKASAESEKIQEYSLEKLNNITNNRERILRLT